MTRRRAVAWVAAVTLSAAGFAQLPRVVVDRAHVVRPPSSKDARAADPAPTPLDSAWQAAPFRIDRRLPPVRYEVAMTGDALPAEMPPERPPWTLIGIVAGEAPLALFRGVAETPDRTRVIAIGEVVEGYVLAAIRGDTAVVALDTTEWTYTRTVPGR